MENCVVQWWPGNLSYRDFTADLAGIAVAAAGISIYSTRTPPTTAAGGTPASQPATVSGALAALVNSLSQRPGRGGGVYSPVPEADVEMGSAVQYYSTSSTRTATTAAAAGGRSTNTATRAP